MPQNQRLSTLNTLHGVPIDVNCNTSNLTMLDFLLSMQEIENAAAKYLRQPRPLETDMSSRLTI